MLNESWLGEVYEKSAIFANTLKAHPLVKEIRAEGLLIAVDLKNEDYAQQILPLLLEEGVLSDWFLFYPGAFRIAPPLPITVNEVKMASEAILRALDRIKL